MSEKVDAVVIGMGPGGEQVAEELAGDGLRVAGVERELVGGECPYWGCIPSKMVIRAANLLAEARRVRGVAGDASVRPEWAPVAARIRRDATDDWDDRVAVERFERAGGLFIRGSGRLDGPGRVVVDGRVLEASRAVVVATGSSPVVPPIPGLAEAGFWTNRDVLRAETLPRSLVVLGGGAIGLELAQAYARFGVQVTIVEGRERVLAMEEPEAGDILAHVLAADGVDLRLASRAESVRRDGDETVVTLAGGGEVRAERLLVATGRRANISGLGLETVGIDTTGHALRVDRHMRAADGVLAIGDVTGEGAFTHVAVYQARIAIAEILGREHPGADYHALPRVTFTDPEVGAVGLTEQQAAERGLRVRTGCAPVSQSSRGWIHGPGNDGFIKLVEDADRRVLVGATSMGPTGGEVLYGLSVAVHAGVPTESLRGMITAFPTFHRGVEDALAALGRG
jgi:pyruvate/2-oxoglutarate dehydrogenase complex dihydrolipoamide dehydrogenase (E3) component